ncbi:MAG: preprotein translocase subunit SecG [Deltaproteobacteria bacterium]|nr:preprotein translocase subunit SecG [Deltaproteobacteria bacterium]MCB9478881.1 preprotein translocase subunit SecG [Deltaproteobacteria bacterium]MCB9489387.1 preprotein translocase subunit SecG [Deltaproteobacteria bacterium]
MVDYILTGLHVVLCLFLILVILLQSGKGADMGAVFGGGGSNTVFGSSGGATFMAKLTAVAAALFMITCLSLAYMGGHTSSGALQKLEDLGKEAVGTVPMPSEDTTSEGSDTAPTAGDDTAAPAATEDGATSDSPAATEEAPTADAGEAEAPKTE